MIRLQILKIDEEQGIVCVSLDSSDGGKLASKSYNGEMKVLGIPRGVALNLVMSENKEYFIADGKIKLIRDKIDEFKASRRKGNNRSQEAE